MPFAAALSTHPVSSHATGELIGQVIEEVGSHPDVALLLATPGHAGALEDVAKAVRHLLAPTLLIGTTAPALAGQGADEQGGAAMALWAGITGPIGLVELPGPVAPPPFEVSGAVVLGRETVVGREMVIGQGGGQGGIVGPEGTGGEGLLGALSASPLEGRVVGGFSAGPLLLGDRTSTAGAVGVLFGPGVRFEAVTATDWRVIGPEMAITDSDPGRGLVLALDGMPALDRLRRLASDEVPAEEIGWINRRLGIGPATAAALSDEDPLAALPGDDPAASVREVRGGDRSNGAIAAGAFPVGSLVRFWVGGDREAGLRRVLGGRVADTVLVFASEPASRGYPPAAGGYSVEAGGSSVPAGGYPGASSAFPAGRGAYPGGAGGHSGPANAHSGPADASVIADALGVQRVLGLLAPAQLGPIGGRLHLSRRDITMALLADPLAAP